MKVKNSVTIFAVVLLIILVIFTFVSKSIYHNSLPVVTTVSPKPGSIVLSEDSVGTIEYPNAQKLYSAGTWTVNNVKVKDGDMVAKGDLLCSFDTRAAEINIQTLALNVLMQKDALEKLKKYNGTNKKGMALTIEEALNKKLNDKTYQQVVAQTQLKIAQAQLDLAMAQAPPAGGMIAPIDGIVYGVSIKKEDTIQSGVVIMTIVPSGEHPSLKFQLPSDKGGTYGVGARVDAKMETRDMDKDKKVIYQQENVTGFVTKSILGGEVWEYEVELGKFKGEPVAGQKVPLKVSSEKSGDNQYVIPISSLFNNGEGGKCVFVIEERKGLFGQENYLTAQTVNVVAENGKSALINGEIDVGQKIASKPSKPIVEGSVVSCRNYK